MEKEIKRVKQLDKEQRNIFYQAQYKYYKSFNRSALIISIIAYFAFFFTDCWIFGRFAYETLLARTIVIFPMIVFMYLYKQNLNYRVMVMATYFMVHIIIWCTDWATYFLPVREFTGEGMIIMNLIFACVGFCAPFKYSIIAHCGLLLDILIANLFMHYDNVAMMIVFNVICVVAVGVIHYTMENVYLEHYLVTKQLETLVVHDQLTGVYNRNKFESISDAVTQELIVPQGMEVTLLIVDVDFFKKVNDQYGHEAGDLVIKGAAQAIKESVRASDYVVRWGGEEFMVLLVDCNLEKGITIAEKMRVNIENSDNGVCPISASIGIAEYQGGNYHDTIKCADKALYRAKAEGRNRVVVYEG